MRTQKKNLKHFLGLAICAMMITFTANAQEEVQVSEGHQGEKMTEKMVQTLQLDKTQEQKVSAINEETMIKMYTVKEQHKEDREKARVEMIQIRNEQDRQMKEVLTADQYNKYLELKAERRENMQRKRAKMMGHPSDR